MVSVLVFTYNQEKLIVETLSSIAQQITNFEVETIIGEDASTDTTRKVCESFIQSNSANIRLYPEEKNVGYLQNFIRLVRASKGKYLTFIAGDDYWVGNDRLQKQFDFLEANPDHAFIHSRYNISNETTGTIETVQQETNQEFLFDRLLVGNEIAALTVMVRRDLVIEAIDSGIYTKGYLMEDYPLWLYISSRFKVGFLDEVTAVWRYWEESASNSKDIRKKIVFNENAQNVRRDFAIASGRLMSIQKILIREYQWLFVHAYKQEMLPTVKNAYQFLKENNSADFSTTVKYYVAKNPFLKKMFDSGVRLKNQLVGNKLEA